MSYQLVIFDLGGVLVKVEPKPMLERIAKETGQSEEHIWQVLNDASLVEAFQLGTLSPKQFYEEIRTRLMLGWGFEDFVTAWNGILRENTDTTWVLQRLRSRYRLLVLTNTNVLHDQYIRQTWPVFSQVHHWIASYEVGLRKPDPAIYQVALREADMAPEATVFIDDMKECVETAEHLGLAAVHFTDGLRLEQELLAAGLHV